MRAGDVSCSTVRTGIAGGAIELAHWLAAGIGLFWAVRAVLQVTYYSRAHWQGNPGRTVIHAVLLATYGGLATVYIMAAWLGFTSGK